MTVDISMLEEFRLVSALVVNFGEVPAETRESRNENSNICHFSAVRGTMHQALTHGTLKLDQNPCSSRTFVISRATIRELGREREPRFGLRTKKRSIEHGLNFPRTVYARNIGVSTHGICSTIQKVPLESLTPVDRVLILL